MRSKYISKAYILEESVRRELGESGINVHDLHRTTGRKVERVKNNSGEIEKERERRKLAGCTQRPGDRARVGRSISLAPGLLVLLRGASV